MSERTAVPGGVTSFLFRRRGRSAPHWTDIVSYGYLVLAVLVMFLPILWLVLSSFKSPSNITEFPPTLLPYEQETVLVPGFENPLPLYRVEMPDGESRVLAQVGRVGLQAQMIDPAEPETRVAIRIDNRDPVRRVVFATENYTDLLSGRTGFRIGTYAYNSLFITVFATIITVLINSMAAFALSKYRFRGRDTSLVLILSTLLVPSTIILVPVFLVMASMGLVGGPWAVILPTVATPTGVFLLRQYMLTIPDELLDAARMDHASEWQIFWRIVLPLSAPAVAVVTIFSIMSRWNDFLLPLIMLSRQETFTLQLALNQFQGQYNVEYHYLLAMTTLTALPIAGMFLFMQKYIASGIATTGMK